MAYVEDTDLCVRNILLQLDSIFSETNLDGIREKEGKEMNEWNSEKGKDGDREGIYYTSDDS